MFVMRIGAFAVLILVSGAHADVVCIKSTGKSRSIKIRAGDGCQRKETLLGTFDGLKALIAASASAPPTGNGTLHLENVEMANVQIVSPVTPPTAASIASAPRERCLNPMTTLPTLGRPSTTARMADSLARRVPGSPARSMMTATTFASPAMTRFSAVPKVITAHPTRSATRGS